ncbi:MAG: Zn-ribbon domain-containing protein [Candidatus Aenigmarchaeota archaeon]|nr:Zn-ribbon domain-containing protein [Candidatus Aenigmarchaeota archaeon]
MSHKCLRCGKIYEDNDPQIINGCSCGSVFFFFIKDKLQTDRLEEIEKILKTQKTSLENELEKEFIKVATGENNFGIETIKNPLEGVYEINLDALMKREPLVILKQGKTYLIHLPSVFEKVRSR